MEKSEPSLVPEWLRNGNNSSHLFTSPSQTDSSTARGRSRTNPSLDPLRSSFLDRSSSSNSRKFFSNGSQKSAYSSFSRSHRDKEKDRVFLNDPWDHDSIDHVGIRIQRSHSMVARKQDDSFPRTLNSNGSTHKSALEEDFPSLVIDEKPIGSDCSRAPSPLLTERWTSALVDVPNSQSNGNAPPKMAEALTQTPLWPRVSPVQPPIQTQRREEIAIKQSKQLIPVTPPMPKVASTKPSVRSNEATSTSTPPVKHSHGKLFVLKPGWENGSLPKENAQTGLNKPAPSTSAERKPKVLPGFPLDKKPSLSQTQSRNDFFNNLKKKTTPSTAPAKPEPEPVSQNDSVSLAPEEPFSEEETAFLRSLGWEENSGEGELTEEEISLFKKEYMNRMPSSKKATSLEKVVV